MPRPRRLMLDKQNAKLGGVCAGIADYTGVTVVWVRIGLVFLTFALSGFVWIGYIAAVFFLPNKPLEYDRRRRRRSDDDYDDDLYDDDYHSGAPGISVAEAWAHYRAVEQRLTRIEAYHTGHNSSLARQIAALSNAAPRSASSAPTEPHGATDARAVQALIDAARTREQANAVPARPSFGRAVR